MVGVLNGVIEATGFEPKRKKRTPRADKTYISADPFVRCLCDFLRSLDDETLKSMNMKEVSICTK